MHKGDRARFLREEGGDTFCFVNTNNVKTLIEIMKYSLKVDKIFLKYILQVIILAYFYTFNVYVPSPCTLCYRNGK